MDSFQSLVACMTRSYLVCLGHFISRTCFKLRVHSVTYCCNLDDSYSPSKMVTQYIVASYIKETIKLYQIPKTSKNLMFCQCDRI